MKKHTFRCLAMILVFSVVCSCLLCFSSCEEKGNESLATVTKGTLYSTISSTGNVSRISSTTGIPVAALIYDVRDIADLANTTFETNWATVLMGANDTPVSWRVDYISDDISEKPFRVDGHTEEVDLLRLTPMYFDLDSFRVAYEKAVEGGETETLINYAMKTLFTSSVKDIDPSIALTDVFKADPEGTRTVSTSFLNDLMKASVALGSDLEYTISRVTYREGDYLTLESTLLTASYEESFITYSVSEYDFAEIDARMRRGENVYASATVNALDDRAVLAKVIRKNSASVVSGVTYYTLLAKLIYAHVTEILPEPEGEGEVSEDAAPTYHVDFTYYNEELDDAFIRRLELPVDKNTYVTPDEVADKYSVTVTSQNEAVEHTLIVPTKCIFYDDAKKPYVIRVDVDEKEKETRVYIKITLSTGTEAAVIPLNDLPLSEGDKIRFYGDSTLLSSLF